MKTFKVLSSIALLSVALPFSQIDAVNYSHTVKAATKAGYPTSKYKKGAPLKFGKCKDLNKYYPYGVTYNHKSYRPGLDRDKDKMACEAKDMVFKAWMAKN
ncbi:excalibur calcium-binding domain-containing protein [Macrococcoides bohemicum]|uniref:excalibur calcium-binding domain-containing protein n=1 Tax=Macrococcoides bohemicum TaxID=1903056 RepID=UPI0039C94EFC